jgi:hypothetical protein
LAEVLAEIILQVSANGFDVGILGSAQIEVSSTKIEHRFEQLLE